jgi:preprotein translocase subunit YajC
VLADQREESAPGSRGSVGSPAGDGRLVSKDEDAVKAVIEIAPGTQVTVHLQTLTNGCGWRTRTCR